MAILRLRTRPPLARQRTSEVRRDHYLGRRWGLGPASSALDSPSVLVARCADLQNVGRPDRAANDEEFRCSLHRRALSGTIENTLSTEIIIPRRDRRTKGFLVRPNLASTA